MDELWRARARDVIMPLLYPMRVGSTPRSTSTYKVLQGRHDIYALRTRMLEDATSSIDWASTFLPSVALADASGALAVLKRRAEAGVRIRAALRTTANGWARMEAVVTAQDVELRELDDERKVRFFIIDCEEMLIWGVNDPSASPVAKDEVALQTTAPGFFQAGSLSFEQTWSRARPRRV